MRRAQPSAMRWLFCLCALLLATALVSPAHAQSDSEALERRVKAAFLFRFTDYVSWPDGAFANAESPIAVGVLGDDQVAAELGELVTGRKVAGRSVVVRRLREGDSLADVHVLFIGRSANARLAQLLKLVQARPVLTVTEAEAALAQASVINFVLAEGRVRFDIALDVAEKKGLRLSSRLLTVALNVRPGPR